MTTRLRLGPSGPFAKAADLASNPNIGDYLSRDANGNLIWNPLPPPPPPPTFTMRQMYRVRVLDGATTAPLAEQNGTFQAPYGTMAQCIADLPQGGTVLVVPQNYSYAPWNFTHENTLTIVNLASIWNDVYGSSDQYVVAPGFESTLGGLVLIGVALSTSIDVHSFPLWMKYSSADGSIACGNIVADSCTFANVGAITAVGAENDFTNCYFNIAGQFLECPTGPKFRDCRFGQSCSVLIAGGGGSIIFDQASFNSWAEMQCTTNGVYTDIGAPLGGVVNTVANAALPAGRSLVADVAVTGTYNQPCVVCNFCGAVPPSGVTLDGHYSVGHVEIYANNYTGGPLNYPGGDVRWKLLVP